MIQPVIQELNRRLKKGLSLARLSNKTTGSLHLQAQAAQSACQNGDLNAVFNDPATFTFLKNSE